MDRLRLNACTSHGRRQWPDITVLKMREYDRTQGERIGPDYGYFRTRMLSGEIISGKVSTASKAEAGICFSSAMRPSGQRLSAVPWKYHADPLSARASP